MADVAPIPFINFGLSQQEQAQAGAAANLQNQQANVASQQAQQQQMQTELMQRSMPIYRQTIDNMLADMSGTPASNAMSPQASPAPAQSQAAADQSGASPTTPGAVPAYADPGAIAEYARATNYVQPFTPQEQRALFNGAMMASLPGPAANPAFLKMAQMQNQFRIANQTRMNQYRSGQLYDVMTAVQDDDNPDPLSALRAVPGQQGVVAQIVKDHPGDVAAQQDAARKYAQMTAFNMHQYTGRGQTMQNGVLIDTTVGAPVTGQDQVLTGLTPEQRAKAMQYAMEPIPVVLNTGDKTQMPRYKAPVAQGGLGMTPEAFVARQDALARQHLNDPNAPEPGLSSWNSPSAIGNTSGASAAAQGNTLPQHAPGAQPSLPPGTRPAVGRQLQTLQGQSQLNNAPTPQTALSGPVPAVGTPQYTARMQAALSDPTYKARWNIQPQPGLPIPGASAGITQYQTQRNELMKEAGENSQAADQSLMNFQAAKAILGAPDGSHVNAVSGIPGAIMQRLGALGFDTATADQRAEAAKYLTQAAIAGLKQTYGSKPGVFDVKVNLEHAFPNVASMPYGALNNLIDSQIAQARYIKDSAVRAQVYASKGLEPNSFPTWNATYFPKSGLVADMQPGQQQQQQQGAATQAPPVRITTPAQAYALPRGTRFMTPDGRIRVRN